MILVYAGRRIDSEDSGDRRFPLASVPRVADGIERTLRALRPDCVVGSAACGADLLVLEAAERLGIRRRVILPFDRTRFRESSVVDRPGEWGPRFDAVIGKVTANGDLVELRFDPKDPSAYDQVNAQIFLDAESIARERRQPCRALVLWNGSTRGIGDVTEAFLAEARRRAWHVTEIDTAQPAPSAEPI
jgi:hypothetical protein